MCFSFSARYELVKRQVAIIATTVAGVRFLPSAVAFIWSVAQCHVVVGQSYDLVTVRAALRDYVSSVSSISANFSVTYQANNQAPEAPRQYEWGEDGPRRYLVSPVHGSAEAKDLLSYDGHRGYTYRYGEARSPSLVIDHAMNSGLDHAILPCHPCGLRVERTAYSIADLAELPGTAVTGSETFKESHCIKLETRGFKSIWGQPLRCAFSLDETRAFTPRRIAIFDDRSEPDKRWYSDWEIGELSEVASGDGEQIIWFPKLAVLKSPTGQHELVVNEVKLNCAIAASRFKPEPPDGAFVTDLSTGGRPYIQGGRNAMDAAVRRSADTAREMAAAAGKGLAAVDARPRSAAFAWKALAAGSVGVILVGVMLLILRSRPR